MVPGYAFANAASTRGKWGSVAEVRKHLVDEEDLILILMRIENTKMMLQNKPIDGPLGRGRGAP